jgi:hypothetical protein
MIEADGSLRSTANMRVSFVFHYYFVQTYLL